MPTITLIHTNDLHGRLTPEKAEFLRALRLGADLYFDSGDCVRSGNLAVPLKPDPAWELLNRAGCDASVPGNRESHPRAAGRRAKLAGAAHPVLCANWNDRRGKLVFPSHVVLEAHGLKIAVFGVMVPMVTAKMATQAASSYLWDQPVPAAVAQAAVLRASADLVIALTHVGLTTDRKIADATSDIDLILGGHSHSVLSEPEIVNGTPICQGGSHARFVGRYAFDLKKGLTRAELLPWP